MRRDDKESANAGLARVVVLIPAWKPDARLPELVAALRAFPFAEIVVVDDGSPAACRPVFEAFCAKGVLLLEHGTNRGKGRALRTGFEAVLQRYNKVVGVVTADADGQHTPEDIVRVAEALAAEPQRPVLGVRSLPEAATKPPLRSRLGNGLTRWVFGFITGWHLRDTQTGLRGLPIGTLSALLALQGERYEYEMSMLLHLCRSGVSIAEVPIAIVYLENNRSSHFRPVWDSLRVAFVLARFWLSSLLKKPPDL